jgi:hypothetical protein
MRYVLGKAVLLQPTLFNPSLQDVTVAVPNLQDVLKPVLRFCTTSFITGCMLLIEIYQMITLQQQEYVSLKYSYAGRHAAI